MILIRIKLLYDSDLNYAFRIRLFALLRELVDIFLQTLYAIKVYMLSFLCKLYSVIFILIYLFILIIY